MNATIQKLYSLLAQKRKNIFPSPILKFDSLINPNLTHTSSKQQTKQQNTLKSSSYSYSYAQYNLQIQMQLQRRIINIGKIKQIGLALYQKLGQDITTLNENSRKLRTFDTIANKIEQTKQKIQYNYQMLVQKYWLIYDKQHDVNYHHHNHNNNDKFNQFIQNSYIPYCHTVNRQIIPTIKSIISQIQIIKIPSNIQQQQQQLQQKQDQIKIKDYQQKLQNIQQVLSRFRSIILSEYQVLMSSLSSQNRSNSSFSQQEYRNAAIFLTKIRNVFVQLKQVLCDKNSNINMIFMQMYNKKQKIIHKIQQIYDKIWGKGVENYYPELNPFYAKIQINKNSIKQGNNEIISIEYQNNNNKDRKCRYHPNMLKIKSFHIQTYIQIILYLILTQTIQNQVHLLQSNISNILKTIQQVFISPHDITNINNKLINPLIQQIQLLMKNMQGVKIKYFWQVQTKLTQKLAQIITMQHILQQAVGIINKYSIIWVKILRRVKYLQGNIDNVSNDQHQNIIIDLCIQIYQIIQFLQQMYYTIHKCYKWQHLQNIINIKINSCKKLRNVLASSLKTTTAIIASISPTASLQSSPMRPKTTRGKQNIQILIELDEQSQQQINEQYEIKSTFSKASNSKNISKNIKQSQSQQLISDSQNKLKQSNLKQSSKNNIQIQKAKSVNIDQINQFLYKCSQLFENQFKNLIGNGFELAIYHLQKGHQLNNDFKIAKLRTSIKKLLENGNYDTRSLKIISEPTLININNEKNKEQKKNQSQKNPSASPASNTSLLLQLQTNIYNIQALQKLINYYSSSLQMTNSIVSMAEQSTNFEYQDWSVHLAYFQQTLDKFDSFIKNISSLTNFNNNGSLFSVVYRTVKEYSSVMQIVCDVFHQIVYIFKNTKQIEKQRRGNINQKYINIVLQQQLQHISKLFSYKLKTKDEIQQIDKFNNLSKKAKIYIKVIYTKFKSNYDAYLVYSEQMLSQMINKMQIVIGFKQNSAEIFQILIQSIRNIDVKQINNSSLQEVRQISDQLMELQSQLFNIIRSNQSQSEKWPIQISSIQEVKKLVISKKDQFMLATLINQLFQTKGRTHRKSKNIYDNKFSNKNIQILYNKVMQIAINAKK